MFIRLKLLLLNVISFEVNFMMRIVFEQLKVQQIKNQINRFERSNWIRA